MKKLIFDWVAVSKHMAIYYIGEPRLKLRPILLHIPKSLTTHLDLKKKCVKVV